MGKKVSVEEYVPPAQISNSYTHKELRSFNIRCKLIRYVMHTRGEMVKEDALNQGLYVRRDDRGTGDLGGN